VTYNREVPDKNHGRSTGHKFKPAMSNTHQDGPDAPKAPDGPDRPDAPDGPDATDGPDAPDGPDGPDGEVQMF
jgi:hypothetical protein